MADARAARRGPAADELASLERDWLLWGLVAAALICLLLGAVLMAMWAPPFGLTLPVAFALAVACLALAGRRRAERQDALLWALAIAAERGLPLAPVLEAMAEGGGGGSPRRLLALAGLLDAGAPLPEALALVPGTLPREAGRAIALGWRSGRLAGVLREAADGRGAERPIPAALAPRLAYLLAVPLLMKIIVTFLLYFVVPKLEAISMDMGVPLPGVTVALLGGSHWLVRWGWPVLVLMAIAESLLLVVLPLSLGGWLDLSPPLADRLFRRRHSAPILRALAWVVEGGQPLPSGVASLVRHFPAGWVRGRLELVLRDLDDGGDCWKALRDRGLIGPADTAILEASSRVGNLPWALRETAESAERRTVVRLQAWLHVLSLLATLVLGALTLFLMTAFFSPLLAIIERLAE